MAAELEEHFLCGACHEIQRTEIERLTEQRGTKYCKKTIKTEIEDPQAGSGRGYLLMFSDGTSVLVLSG